MEGSPLDWEGWQLLRTRPRSAASAALEIGVLNFFDPKLHTINYTGVAHHEKGQFSNTSIVLQGRLKPRQDDGRVIFRGSVTRSKVSSSIQPVARAACFKVVPSSKAWWAILDALS